MKHVQTFLGVEAIAFATAALVHAGILMDGYQHRQAGIAEGVIAGVLLLGLMVSLLRPRSSRVAGLAAQGFALLGTLVGITMISIGVGPQSAFDVALHVCFVTLLVTGLIVVARRRLSNGPNQGASMSTPRGAMF
jgi:hypothetical protein